MSRAAAGAPGVNLMPLLDVLLCTMGTLIVILGVINREARLHPAKRAHGKAAQEQEQMIEAREDLDLRIEQLKGSKEKTLADLNTSRTKLAGIEDSKRKLEDQLQSLIDASKKLPEKNASDDPQREKLRLELADLNNKRLRLESDLKKERNNASHRQPGFAVIPFDGMYKTSRRPIYIECRGDSVILQPEGIVFGPQDFLGPGGPSNPLACALRAAQEFWRNAPRPAPDMPNEPYPLLLVRPTGIIGYYLVRDAMSSWDAEFGYELVGEDWRLEYPNGPDAKLADMENRAVADSRQQLQWLAQVSPELFSRKSSKVEYHVSPMRGGVVRDGGPQLGNDPFAKDPLGGFGRSGRPGNSAMPGMNGPGGGGNGSFSGGLADARGNSAFGADPNATGSSGPGGQGGLGNGQGGPGNSQSGLSNGQGGFGSGPRGQGNGGLAGGATGMTGGTGGMPGGAEGIANGTPGMNSGPDLGNAAGSFNSGGQFSGNGTAGTNIGSNAGGSGTGNTGSPGNAGAEVANVGPRYAGTGNGAAGFGNGTGQFAGTPSGTGSSSQNLGTGNGNSSSGATGAGNGTSSTAGDKANGSGGTNSLAGAPASRGNIPGGAAGMPSEYGGVMLPNSAGGMMNSSAGSGSGSDGAQSGQYAGGTGGTAGSAGGFGNSSSPGSAAGGGGGSTSAGDSSSSSAGGASSSMGSSSGNPNSPAGMPAMNFDYSPQQQQSAMYDDSTRQQQSSSSSHSMSRNRGKNWALPTSHTSSVPVQRPIRVECWNDRLVLVPDTNDLQPQVIPLGQRTEDSLDPLVGAVRTYTKSWGIAGRGMYWRPQLVLNVNQNADRRASDLQALLADSGWDVKKK